MTSIASDTWRPLGRSGMRVAPLCLGCMLFGTQSDEATSAAILDAYLDAGGNFLDTANIYGAGVGEEVLGRLVRERGVRDRVILTTKFHHAPRDADPNEQGNHQRNIIRSCEASLRRLDVEWIDLYLAHRPDPTVPIDETLRALDRLIQDGKVLAIGTSTFAAWHLAEAWYVAKELGTSRFVCDQAAYNMLDRRAERELIPFCRTYDIAVTPWSPLGGGLLTGKYNNRAPGDTDGRFDRPENQAHPAQKRRTDAALQAAAALVDLASDVGCTASQLAIAWTASQPGVTSPVIGARTLAQFEEAIGSMRIVMTDDIRARIDDIVAPATAVSSYYEIPGASDARP